MHEAVNLDSRIYLRDGRTFPITVMFDADGDETDDTEVAVFLVAGRDNTWYSVDLREFNPPVRAS